MDEFIARIGTFLILIAVGLMLLFVASDAHTSLTGITSTDYNYFFASLILLVLGFLFRKKAPPPPAADRFRSLRRMQSDRNKQKEDMAKAKPQAPSEKK